MFEAWGRALYRRRRLTLGLTLVLVAFAAVWGTGVFGKLSSGDNFTPPASQSQREANQAARCSAGTTPMSSSCTAAPA